VWRRRIKIEWMWRNETVKVYVLVFVLIFSGQDYTAAAASRNQKSAQSRQLWEKSTKCVEVIEKLCETLQTRVACPAVVFDELLRCRGVRAISVRIFCGVCSFQKEGRQETTHKLPRNQFERWLYQNILKYLRPQIWASRDSQEGKERRIYAYKKREVYMATNFHMKALRHPSHFKIYRRSGYQNSI
jgi:hypothetical protein